MTFRKITFSFIALLLSSLIALQFWMIQNYTESVSSKIGEAAFEVSRSTIETILFKQPSVEFKRFAISASTRIVEQSEIVNSISTAPRDINIELKDGQLDSFITINSSGKNNRIDIPRTGIENSLEDMTQKLLVSAIVFILIGLLMANVFSKRLSKPLSKLQKASKQVGKGEFGFQIKTDEKYQSTEINNTIGAFNKMSKEIEHLQKENEKLQQLSQLSELSEITRGLAHTIRNPLNTLNLALDELASTNDQSTKLDLSKISKHQIKRIDKWVHSLMEIMSTDKSLVQDVDINDLLQSCIDDLLLGNRTNIKIKLKDRRIGQSNHETPRKISAIKSELKSLLQGLISNAIESVEALSAEDKEDSNIDRSEIKVLVEQQNSSHLITISDYGVGFKREIKDRLFSPHNTDKTYGAGMGLYLAHRVVSLNYQGNLEVKDNDITSNNIKSEPSSKGAKLVLTLNNRI